VDVDAIFDVLARYRFAFENEAQLQTAITGVLALNSVKFEPEYSLTKAIRLDFLCTDIAIETKVKDSLVAVTRQVHRYLQDPALSGLILITTRSAHRGLPRTINGKPVRVLWLSGAML
jgi:hypothetical protein